MKRSVYYCQTGKKDKDLERTEEKYLFIQRELRLPSRVTADSLQKQQRIRQWLGWDIEILKNIKNFMLSNFYVPEMKAKEWWDREDLSLAGCLRNALWGNHYTEVESVLTNRTFQRRMKLSMFRGDAWRIYRNKIFVKISEESLK